MQKLKDIANVLARWLFLAAIFVAGFGAGLAVNVFMVRGVPVVQGGGEIMIPLMFPAIFYVGYRFGGNTKNNSNGGNQNE